MHFDKIYCSQGSQTSGRKDTKNSSIKTRSSAVILFVLTVCYRKKTAALLSIAGSSGTLDRLPSMFRLTRLRLFLLEHAAGLSISSRNIGNDNNTACPYCTAGPAVFTCPSVIHTSPDRSVSLGTLSRSSGQSADWFVSSRTLAKTARPCSFYICFCFYICLCFYFCFCLRFYFVFAVVSAFGFASLLFSFF